MQENNNNQTEHRTEQNLPNSVKSSRPNESGRIYVTDSIRIFDPKTNEIFLEKRE